MSEREPNVWRLRVMVDGKQVQRTFRGSEADARKALRKLDVQPAEPAAGSGDLTFGNLLAKWSTFQKSRGRAPKTLDENRREIETRIRPRLGRIPLAQLTAEDLDSAYSDWLAEGLASSTVHRHAAVVSAALTQGVKWGWLDASPAVKATAPTAKSTRRASMPTVDQVHALIRAAQADDPMMAAAVGLAFITGARRGELCALRWSDIDLEAGTIRIERSLSEVGANLIEKRTKTGSDRFFTIDAPSVELLRGYRNWQRDLSAVAESPMVEDPYVLSDNANAGRPMRPSKITDRFTALRTAAKVRRVRFHDLRHAAASQQLGAGIDPVTVAARGGWAGTRTLLSTYAHALPAGDVAAAAVMGALLPVGRETPVKHA